MKITDTDAFDLLTEIEGKKWAMHQNAHPGEEHSFYWALARFNKAIADAHGDMVEVGAFCTGTSVIYGDGGWARYIVRSDGTIVLDGSTTHKEKCTAVRSRGIEATDPPDYTAEEREMSALRKKRKADVTSLCHALARDVLVFAGNPKPPPEDPQMTSIMSARIAGWLAARLGILDASVMAEVAEIQMSQARTLKSIQIPADVSARRLHAQEDIRKGRKSS